MNYNKQTWICDFETTAYEGVEKTEVWAAAKVNYESQERAVYNNLTEFMQSFKGENMLYFHNLKFDGAFIIDWLYRKKYRYTAKPDKGQKLPKGHFTTFISHMGVWYEIQVRTKGAILTIKDSLKLLPFTVKYMGETLCKEHHKTEIDYTQHRGAGEEITKKEQEYIYNDVEVVKESLQAVYGKLTKSTIGSYALDYYKSQYKYGQEGVKFKNRFVNLKEEKLPLIEYPDMDSYIRKAYRGGWCYLNPKYRGRWISGGRTYDVNSLYPFIMRTHRFPVSHGYYHKGKPQFSENTTIYLRINIRFTLKSGYVPFIQLKHNLWYSQTEHLTTSYVNNGKPIIMLDGTTREDGWVEMIVIDEEFKLIQEHYNTEVEYIDYIEFWSDKDVFSEYIEHFNQIKESAPNNGIRTFGKLMNNNLYGKFAQSDDSSEKVPFFDKEEDKVKFKVKYSNNKEVINIAVGAAITAYARIYTIKHAQANYDHFIYADTDSCHIEGKEANMFEIHDKKLGKWKIEQDWEKGIFYRQKTYLEVEKGIPYYKCAGMPKRVKDICALCEFGILPDFELSKEESEFVEHNLGKKVFVPGKSIPGKLQAKTIPGGCLLTPTTFTIK